MSLSIIAIHYSDSISRCKQYCLVQIDHSTSNFPGLILGRVSYLDVVFFVVSWLIDMHKVTWTLIFCVKFVNLFVFKNRKKDFHV